MSNIRMGDNVLCINAEGMESHGLQYGAIYVANNVMNIPGQGVFVGVFVEEVGQIVVTDSSRFEKAYTLNYRLFSDNSYVLIDDTWDEEAHKDDENFMDITITLPESQLSNIDAVLGDAIQQVMKDAHDNETAH